MKQWPRQILNLACVAGDRAKKVRTEAVGTPSNGGDEPLEVSSEKSLINVFGMLKKIAHPKEKAPDY